MILQASEHSKPRPRAAGRTASDSRRPSDQDCPPATRRKAAQPSEDSIPQGQYFFWEGFLDDAIAEALMAPPKGPANRRKSNAKPSNLPSYFAHLYRTPLLSAKEELHYFRRYNYLRFREASLVEILEDMSQGRNGKRLNAARLDVEEELESIRFAIKRCRDLLIESNLRLVVALAKRYSESSIIELDEFVAIGNTALMRSVELFDFRRGLRFSTYAYQAVGRAMLTLLNKNRRYSQTFVSVGEGFSELAEEGHIDSFEAEWEAVEALESARILIEELESRDKFIVMSRFGIDRDHNGQSFSRIAADVGLSTTRTVQLFNRSMKKLQRAAESMGLGDLEDEQLAEAIA
ncbi:MAG: sigma-70 family RNA polymerase sigma factor [Planctomycetota bacterium]